MERSSSVQNDRHIAFYSTHVFSCAEAVTAEMLSVPDGRTNRKPARIRACANMANNKS